MFQFCPRLVFTLHIFILCAFSTTTGETVYPWTHSGYWSLDPITEQEHSKGKCAAAARCLPQDGPRRSQMLFEIRCEKWINKRQHNSKSSQLWESDPIHRNRKAVLLIQSFCLHPPEALQGFFTLLRADFHLAFLLYPSLCPLVHRETSAWTQALLNILSPLQGSNSCMGFSHPL